MMDKTFVSTFGFTESLVLAPIVRIGISKKDKITILLPDDLGNEERVSNALGKLDEMLKAISGGPFKLEAEKVPVNDFIKAVTLIRGLLEREAENNPVYVNISGGMRALVIEAYTATLLARNVKPNIYFTELEMEGSAGSLRILPIILPQQLNQTKRRILEELKKQEGPIKTADLSRNLQLSLSTLSRNLREMEADGLVKLERVGRRILIQITKEGRLLA